MKPAYAIHEIQRGKETLAPGKVHTFSEDEYADLERLGALREPNSDELALFEALNPQPEKPSKSPEREDLEAQANALGVKFQANTGDDNLRARIETAKQAAAKKAVESKVESI